MSDVSVYEYKMGWVAKHSPSATWKNRLQTCVTCAYYNHTHSSAMCARSSEAMREARRPPFRCGQGTLSLLFLWAAAHFTRTLQTRTRNSSSRLAPQIFADRNTEDRSKPQGALLLICMWWCDLLQRRASNGMQSCREAAPGERVIPHAVVARLCISTTATAKTNRRKEAMAANCHRALRVPLSPSRARNWPSSDGAARVLLSRSRRCRRAC